MVEDRDLIPATVTAVSHPHTSYMTSQESIDTTSSEQLPSQSSAVKESFDYIIIVESTLSPTTPSHSTNTDTPMQVVREEVDFGFAEADDIALTSFAENSSLRLASTQPATNDRLESRG